MVDVLMKDRNRYIADHLHPNNAGHEEIFRLIKHELDAIINTTEKEKTMMREYDKKMFLEYLNQKERSK